MQKEQLTVTDEQLDTEVEEADLPELATFFDNTEDYAEKLGLSPGQQTDVKTQAFVNGTHTGMKLALKYWRNKNLAEATFRTLLVIIMSLYKGDVAMKVFRYLCDKGNYGCIAKLIASFALLITQCMLSLRLV